MSNKKNSDVKKLGIKHNKKSRSSQQDQDVYKEKSGCTATTKIWMSNAIQIVFIMSRFFG